MKITPDRKMYRVENTQIEEQPKEMVNHPEHYAGDIECRDAMIQQFGKKEYLDFCVMNAFKYIWRHKKKGTPTQDLKKAIWYLNDCIKLMTENE